MILFSDANGTIQTNFGTPVYQGSANSNIIYLIAPYAPAASVLVGFQLPDGSAVAPVAMTPLNAVPGVQNAGGTSYAGWSYVLPAAVTAKYGTVTAQFFFYAPTGESTNPTSIIATSATSFQVGRGAAAVLPDTPDADVYESILSNLAQLQTDLNGGYYGARAIFPWSNGATYGLNEITFYPSIGTYGAFVQSVAAGNTNNAPYVDSAINSAYWKEVVNFNTVTEDYFQQVQEAVAQAESAASEAESSAQAAAGSATTATEQAEAAAGSAGDAAQSATEAANSAIAASTSASQAASSATQSQNSANQSGTYASNAQTSAQNAANSATEAQQYAQQAQQYAQKHYEVVASVSELPRPGDSAFIYLVPTGSGTTGDSYSEYLWITESNDYEFIGTTADIDLSNYAQINGTYAGMTVGNATNAQNATTAQTATNAQQLGGVAAANYAQINGTYSGMTVGNATQAQKDGAGNIITDTYTPRTFLESLYLSRTGTLTASLQVQKPTTNAANYMTTTTTNTSLDFNSATKLTLTRVLANKIKINSTNALYVTLAFATNRNASIEFGARIKIGDTFVSSNQAFGLMTVNGDSGYTNVNEASFNIIFDNIVGLQEFAAGQVLTVEIFTRQASSQSLITRFFCGVNVSNADRNSFAGIMLVSTIVDTSQIADGAVTLQKLSSDVQASLNKADTALQSIPIATSTQIGGVQPVAQTTEMTQPVGVDSNGALWTAPGGGGGITNAEVIEYAEQLPTATADSPNFVQTPDGVLYRKKAVESGGLVGTTYTFKEDIATLVTSSNTFNLSFTSNNGTSYSSIVVTKGSFNASMRYDSTTVWSSPAGADADYYGWKNSGSYKEITITDISNLTNVDEFIRFMDSVATSTGGGASVSYEYVAMQEVPTPTTADNGKVLGVTNGKYALQEASGGGGQLYKHIYTLITGGPGGGQSANCYFTIISSISAQSELYDLLLNNESCPIYGGIKNAGGESTGGTIVCAYKESEEIYIQTTSGILSYSSLSILTGFDTVTPL